MKKYNVTVNGTTYEVVVEEVSSDAVSAAPVYTAPTAAPAPKAAAKPDTDDGKTKVTVPMPGTVLDVKVTPGQSVKKGDTICVLEAMKMENDIPAPCDGVVSTVSVQKGASVNANDVIATIA